MSVKRTRTVNLFGGPGTGKSTTAAGLFKLLKVRGVNADLAMEYAKGKVWEESIVGVAKDQLYMLAKQNHAVFCRLGKVDVIVTDSPIILSLYHGRNMSEAFKTVVMEEYEKQAPVSVFLTRVKPYNPAGRTESEEEARKMDSYFREILDERKIPYFVMTADEKADEKILDLLIELEIVPK